MFDDELRRILEQIDPKTIVEFGFYDGLDSIKYKTWFPGADIYSIEANPVMFEKSVKLLHSHDIKCFNFIIGNKKGINKLIYSVHKNTGDMEPCASVFKPTKKLIEQATHLEFSTTGIEVYEITLKDFCAEQHIDNIDFMHIDVDGYIKAVIEGMGNIRPVVIYAEIMGLEKLFEGAPAFEECDELLKQMGYQETLRHQEELAVLYRRK